MIIYQMKKPIECVSTDCVGVTGDNIAYTQKFYIKGISDNSISYSLHLRFADGSVNSITPDEVRTDDEGTEISWIVKKNDIFMHGYFELQIEGRNSGGLVFQTEIVRLYADESLSVEDKEYENPNSETLRLREEAFGALEEIKSQQEQIDANLKLIWQTDLNNKADKAQTLSGYGITDAYTKTEVDTALTSKLDNCAGSVKTENIASRAVTSDKIAPGSVTAAKIANNAVASNNIAGNQVNESHLVNGSVTTNKLADEVKNSIAEKAKTTYVNTKLAEKYDASNVETGSGELSLYTQSAIDSGLVKSLAFVYQKTGKIVNIFVNIVFNAGSASYLQLTGLPFRGDGTSDQNRYIAATNRSTQVIVYPVGSWLTLNFNSAKSFTQDETLKCHIAMQIN